VQQSIDIACPPGPTVANPPNAVVAAKMGQTDRRTDGRTPYPYIDPAAYYAGSVKFNKVRVSYAMLTVCFLLIKVSMFVRHNNKYILTPVCLFN